ncbi:hypothetical protein HK096_008444, partial [Nowakowskiella sp. JEL0078]
MGAIDVNRYPEILDPETVAHYSEAVGLSASIVALARAAELGNEYSQEMYVSLVALGYPKMTFVGPRFAGVLDSLEGASVEDSKDTDQKIVEVDKDIASRALEMLGEWYWKKLEQKGIDSNKRDALVAKLMYELRKESPQLSSEMKDTLPCLKAWVDFKRDQTGL